MASAPVIDFRKSDNPNSSIGFALFVQSALGGGYLPVLQGENSNTFIFRVYNNFARAVGIASAFNVDITTFDSVDPSSHLATKSVINQQWIRVYENGYGENSTPPGLYSRYLGADTAVGGQGNLYVPETGSDGSTSPQIRAGTDTDGVGFIELATYAELPDVVGMVTNLFAISIQYEWTS